MFPGKQASVRLNRSQIDKVSKDKSGKFSENFNVTFFYDVASEHVITNIFNKANSFQHLNQFLFRHMLCSLERKLVFNSTGVRSTKPSQDKSGKFSENFNVMFIYDGASEHVMKFRTRQHRQYMTITYYRSRLSGRKKKLSNPLPNCLSRSNVSSGSCPCQPPSPACCDPW